MQMTKKSPELYGIHDNDINRVVRDYSFGRIDDETFRARPRGSRTIDAAAFAMPVIRRLLGRNRHVDDAPMFRRLQPAPRVDVLGSRLVAVPPPHHCGLPHLEQPSG
jgi:hypothetical protein